MNPALTANGIRSYACALKRFVPDRPGHDRRCHRCLQDSQRVGGRPALISIAVCATVRWYLEHREWCEAVQMGGYRRERLGPGRKWSRRRRRGRDACAPCGAVPGSRA
jgi:dTDP-glucose 4,6-dehydratase